jgi:hypothetical protein
MRIENTWAAATEYGLVSNLVKTICSVWRSGYHLVTYNLLVGFVTAARRARVGRRMWRRNDRGDFVERRIMKNLKKYFLMLDPERYFTI